MLWGHQICWRILLLKYSLGRNKEILYKLSWTSCHILTRLMSPYGVTRPMSQRLFAWFVYCSTYWGRVTHICVGKLTTIGSDNGFSPGRRQAIIWTSAGILLIGPLGTNFTETLIKNQTFSFTKMYLKVSYAKCRLFCLDLNVLIWFEWHYRHNGIHAMCAVGLASICNRTFVISTRTSGGGQIPGMNNGMLFFFLQQDLDAVSGKVLLFASTAAWPGSTWLTWKKKCAICQDNLLGNRSIIEKRLHDPPILWHWCEGLILVISELCTIVSQKHFHVHGVVMPAQVFVYYGINLFFFFSTFVQSKSKLYGCKLHMEV